MGLLRRSPLSDQSCKRLRHASLPDDLGTILAKETGAPGHIRGEETGIKRLPQRIGARLLDLRHGAQLSQERLAKEAGVSINYISLIEKGRRLPSLEVLSRLAEALGAPMTVFLDEDIPDGALERELDRLATYLRRRQPEDVRKLYAIARTLFAD
jgi:transcriptional regulator with XRE-family HTH domain